MRKPNARKRNKQGEYIASEHDIMDSIMQMLPLYNIFALRINSGMVQSKYGRMIKLAPAGTPDILGVRHPDGKFIGIEVKRPGKHLTPSQERMHMDLKGYGAIVIVASSIDDLKVLARK